MRALNIATTGMIAQQNNIEVTSNNLANMSTTGYKRQKAEFQDLIYQNLRRVGTQSADTGIIVPTGMQMGLGARMVATNRINEQGTLDRTENPLDLAVNGKGFFQVDLPDGTIGYTRDGSFKLSPEGVMLTSEGYPVQPNITVPQDALDITVNRSGEVSVTFAGQIEPQILGQLEIATFINPAGLQAKGGNIFLETAASGQPQVGIPAQLVFGEIFQGFLETSNVDPITEITSLITAQRSYEMNSKVISTADEMLQATTSAKR
jgi:flagellar basal-body rod protein FlgG